MNASTVMRCGVAAAALLIGPSVPCGALGTAFTYQGQLQQSGTPTNEVCDVQFSLFDAAVGGAQIGSTQTASPVTLTNGLFTVQLDFGASAFDGSNRWLQIAVRCPTGSGSYTTLAPRQPLTAAPYALYAPSAGIATDVSCTGCLGTADLTNGAVTTVKLSASGSTTGQVLTSNGSGVAWQTPSGTTGWNLTGNSGTTASNFLGTNDNKALELRVNGARVLRLEPNTSPNVIAGFSGNAANPTNALGATIGGGGAAAALNAAGDFGTVGGGRANVATGTHATVAGGTNNSAVQQDSTVCGGSANTANRPRATVGGGSTNEARGDSNTVAGGFANRAIGDFAATIGGGQSNVAAGNHATVGGGFGNVTSASFATIGGGGGPITQSPDTGNQVRDNWGTVGGGSGNRVGNDNADPTDAEYATVGGGAFNTAADIYATVGGGFGNYASAAGATISGGTSSRATGRGSNVAGGFNNLANGDNSMIAGGAHNSVDGAGSFAAGQDAHADHDASFVWSDGSRAGSSAHANDFNVTATGGVEFWHGGSFHCDLHPTAMGWDCTSDRNLKENFVPVDARDTLRRVGAMPVSWWNPKGTDPANKHIGPVAQDFHAAFGVGGETTINTSDAQGVTFAAIQGLYQLLQEKDAAIAALQNQNAALEARLQKLEGGIGTCAIGTQNCGAQQASR